MKHTVRKYLPQSLLPLARSAVGNIRMLGKKLGRKLDRRTMSENEFGELLAKLGVVPGSTVMVHSSMQEIARRVPGMTVSKLIARIRDQLGPNGTLLMPTFPFSGRQADYVTDHRSFNPRSTPCQVGLLPEVFRRMPGVRRSMHPTHPVAATGKHADDIVGTHHLGQAFAETSPFCIMGKYEGIVIGLGVTPVCFTILHTPEYLHPKSREQQYNMTSISMTIIDGNTTTLYELYTLRGDRDRYYGRAIRALTRAGVLKCVTVRGLQCCTAPAKEFIEHSLKLIDKDQYYGG